MNAKIGTLYFHCTYNRDFVKFLHMRAKTSQTPRHIRRNAENAIALDEIFGVDDIAAADSVLVLFAEAQKRICGISNAGLYLNGIYFVLRFAVIRENKVNFNTLCTD